MLALLLASRLVFDFSPLKCWQFDSYGKHHTFLDPLNSEENDMNWNAWESSLDYQMLQVHSGGRVPSKTLANQPSCLQQWRRSPCSSLKSGSERDQWVALVSTCASAVSSLGKSLVQRLPYLSQHLLLPHSPPEINPTITWLLKTRGSVFALVGTQSDMPHFIG